MPLTVTGIGRFLRYCGQLRVYPNYIVSLDSWFVAYIYPDLLILYDQFAVI